MRSLGIKVTKPGRKQRHHFGLPLLSVALVTVHMKVTNEWSFFMLGIGSRGRNRQCIPSEKVICT